MYSPGSYCLNLCNVHEHQMYVCIHETDLPTKLDRFSHTVQGRAIRPELGMTFFVGSFDQDCSAFR